MISMAPQSIVNDGKLTFHEEIRDGIVYELPFEGNDDDAELLEKSSGLSLLGECEQPYEEPMSCIITGKMTTKKQYLARMY